MAHEAAAEEMAAAAAVRVAETMAADVETLAAAAAAIQVRHEYTRCHSWSGSTHRSSRWETRSTVRPRQAPVRSPIRRTGHSSPGSTLRRLCPQSRMHRSRARLEQVPPRKPQAMMAVATVPVGLATETTVAAAQVAAAIATQTAEAAMVTAEEHMAMAAVGMAAADLVMVQALTVEAAKPMPVVPMVVQAEEREATAMAIVAVTAAQAALAAEAALVGEEMEVREVAGKVARSVAETGDSQGAAPAES